MRYLSKLSILFLIFLVATSCGYDDDNGDYNTPTQDEIVGTWTLLETRIVLSSNNNETTDQTFSSDLCNAPVTFNFGADGNLTTTDFELDLEEAIEGNLDLFCQVENGLLQGNWQFLTGNNYILTIDGDSQGVDINFLNNNNAMDLIILNDESDDPTDPFTQEITLKFNKN